MHKTYHDKQKEIEKVMKRVPNWLSKGYKEINSVILLKFLELKKKTIQFLNKNLTWNVMN